MLPGYGDRLLIAFVYGVLARVLKQKTAEEGTQLILGTKISLRFPGWVRWAKPVLHKTKSLILNTTTCALLHMFGGWPGGYPDLYQDSISAGRSINIAPDTIETISVLVHTRRNPESQKAINPYAS